MHTQRITTVLALFYLSSTPLLCADLELEKSLNDIYDYYDYYSDKEPPKPKSIPLPSTHNNNPIHAYMPPSNNDTGLHAQSDSDGDHGSSNTSLHHAAQNGHQSTCAFLIQKGANINPTSHNRSTPLHLAASQGHMPIINKLLSQDANIDTQNNHDNEDNTPFQPSLLNKPPNAFNANFDGDNNNNTNEDTQVKQKNTTPSQSDSEANLSDIYDYYDYYSDKEPPKPKSIPLPPTHNNNPIHAYMPPSNNDTGLHAQSDSDGDHGSSNTSLHHAAQNGHTSIAHMLLSQGANINPTSHTTPLHFATSQGHMSTIRMLLSQGANIDTQNNHDNEDNTPFQPSLLNKPPNAFNANFDGDNNNNTNEDTQVKQNENMSTIHTLLSQGTNIDTQNNHDNEDNIPFQPSLLNKPPNALNANFDGDNNNNNNNNEDTQVKQKNTTPSQSNSEADLNDIYDYYDYHSDSEPPKPQSTPLPPPPTNNHTDLHPQNNSDGDHGSTNTSLHIVSWPSSTLDMHFSQGAIQNNHDNEDNNNKKIAPLDNMHKDAQEEITNAKPTHDTAAAILTLCSVATSVNKK